MCKDLGGPCARFRSPPAHPPGGAPAPLTAARAGPRAVTAAGKGLLRGALERRGRGGHAVRRALFAPVQIAAARDVRGSRHPVAQVGPGAEGARVEGAAESRVVPHASPVAQAIEAFRAPRMHLGRADEGERARPTEPRPPPRPRRSRRASGGKSDNRKSRLEPGSPGST